MLLVLMIEKNKYSDLRHEDDPVIIPSSSAEYYSIKDIREAIGKGIITAAGDLAPCYIKMVH